MAAKKEPEGDGLKSIFVISPIGKTDENGIDFTKLFLEQIVKPAAKEAGGFNTPVRADEVKAPGSITAKVVSDIVNADVCVADLTGRNPNVMYEVAIAHAAGKPVILLQQEEGGPPFDFTGERTIHYSIRVDEANEARDNLVEYLRNANQDETDPLLKRTMNPVRMIFEDLRTKAQAVPMDRAILERLDALGAEVRELRVLERRPSGGAGSPGVLADAGDGLTYGDLLTVRGQLQAISNTVSGGDGPPPSAGLKLAAERVVEVLATKRGYRSIEPFATAWDDWENETLSSKSEPKFRQALLNSIHSLIAGLDSPILGTR